MSSEHSNPIDVHGLRHRMPADAVVSRYAPTAARQYARRCMALAALGTVAFVAIIVLSVANGVHIALAVIGCVIVGALVIYALLGASTAKETWGDDDRLAIAVSGEGIVLPRFGLIQWGEVASLKVVDTRVFTISKALQDWAFGSTDQAITVYLSNVDAVLARANDNAKFGLVMDPSGSKTGIVGGFGRHMQQPSFAEMVHTLTAQAAQHGVPVAHNGSAR